MMMPMPMPMTSAPVPWLMSTASADPLLPVALQRRSRWHLSRRVTPYRIGLGALMLAVLAYYLWSAATSLPFTLSTANTDPYNLLTSAFLHGHLYLPLKVPAGLLRLRDPYNPALNGPYAAPYHDLSLYAGHFYMEWGPTPVLSLFAPFRLTGARMSESLAVAIYGFIGFVCAVVLLHVLVRRLVPETARWVLFVGSVTLAFSNAVPFLLRRPYQYEVAISCGYCFTMAGLLLVVTSLFAPRPGRVRLALGSLCLGLAVGGRPTMGVTGAMLLAATWWLVRRRGERPWIALNALGPFIACGVLLILYNELRFHSLTDFGEGYQLAGIDPTTAVYYSPSYIVPGLFTYLLLPARLALTFPHAFLMTAASDPISLPKNYIGAPGVAGAEPTGGIFTTIPITLLLAVVPFMWRRRQPRERRVAFAAAGLAGIGLIIVFFTALGVFATTQRYEVDFATLFVLPALIIWALLIVARPVRSWGRRAVLWGGVVLIAFGCALGAAFGVTGYYDYLRLEHPAQFNFLEDLTSPLAALAVIVVGHPQIARVDSGPLPVTLPPINYASDTEDGAAAYVGTVPLSLTIISPGSRTMAIGTAVTANPGSPPLSQLALRVASPGHRPVVVPLSGGVARLPIFLHLGLNRVRITLVQPPVSSEQLTLANLELIS
jgi:hypothetical protein